MSKFVNAYLGGLELPLEPLDTDKTFQQRITDFTARAKENGFDYNVGQLETDPVAINQQTSAYFDTLLKARIQDGIKSVMLATASGAFLDHIAFTYYRGMKRLEGERDEDFKPRIALAPEGYSHHGTEGGYTSAALSADVDVRDCAIYSEEDGAVFADGTPLVAPDILGVVLSHYGNGAPSQALLDKVYASIFDHKRRTNGDLVAVEPATIVEYEVVAVLKFRQGADVETLRAEAEKRVQDYVTKRHYVSRVHQREVMGGALSVTGVEEIDIIQPAQDVDPGSKGAAFCTKITITTEYASENWR